MRRIIRQVIGELDDDVLHAFLLLSIFPASFSTLAAAEVLGLAGVLYCHALHCTVPHCTVQLVARKILSDHAAGVPIVLFYSDVKIWDPHGHCVHRLLAGICSLIMGCWWVQ